VAVEWVQQQSKDVAPKSVVIQLQNLNNYLGQPDYIREKISVNSVGIATGLACRLALPRPLNSECSPKASSKVTVVSPVDGSNVTTLALSKFIMVFLFS
jgi:hypothetical protein